MFSAVAGFAAGLLHVLSGPDHLAAVAPFAAAGGGQWRAGLRWGLGHTTGVLLIGLLMIAFRGVLPIDALSAYSERVVGLVLIGVGVWAFFRARTPRPAHYHVDAGASFGVGVLHGFAGSSHLFGVLPALALPTNAEALLYLGGFGIAAIVGMTAFASIVGGIALSAACRGAVGYRHLLYACSASAFVVGGYWLVA